MKKNILKLVNGVIRCIDFFIALNFETKSKQGIAIVRLDAIGDFVLWLDAAKEYRRIYPDQKITLIANFIWAELANNLTHWDEVLPVDLADLSWKRPLQRWFFLYKVSRRNFEIVIQPTFSRTIMRGDSVVRASNARHRIGSAGDLSNISEIEKIISDRWYTRLIAVSPGNLMELYRNKEFVDNLSNSNFISCLPRLSVREKLPNRLQPMGDYVIVFPGASWHGKQWPINSFIQVSVELDQRYGLRTVLCGNASEIELCRTIAAAVPRRTLNLAGETTLNQITELIRSAKLLLSNDSSAIHIATAVGTPSVCILGGGHYGRFLPYPKELQGIKPLVAVKPMHCFNCNWQCNQSSEPLGAMPCISGVAVSHVLLLAQEALNAVQGNNLIFKNRPVTTC